MASVSELPASARAAYTLEGTLLEVCSCGVLCPCWVGEDPDLGECFAVNAYHFDSGEINGVDISGLNYAIVVHIPGNVLTPASWRVVKCIDARASEEQRDALVGVYRGDFGGPLADLAGLTGEVLGVEIVPFTHEIVAGRGTLRIGDFVEAEMAPFRGGDGTITTLRDSLFSTVPGSPAYVAKAARTRVSLPKYGLAWEYQDNNAIQSDYRIEYSR